MPDNASGAERAPAVTRHGCEPTAPHGGADPAADVLHGRIDRTDRLSAGRIHTAHRRFQVHDQLMVCTEAMTWVWIDAGNGAAPNSFRLACPSVEV